MVGCLGVCGRGFAAGGGASGGAGVKATLRLLRQVREIRGCSHLQSMK